MFTRRTLLVLMFIVNLTLAVSAQQNNAPATNGPTADDKARAQEVLKQARAAIWDETKSKPLKSLSITTSVHRPRGNREIVNETTIDILMPDKFLRIDVYNYGIGAELTSIHGINGTRTWSDLRLNSGGTPGSGGGMAPAPPGPPNESGRSPEQIFSGGGGAPDGGMMIQFYQAPEAEVDRMLLTWLLIAPATLSAEFTYAGETKVEGKTADIIEVITPSDFKTKLYISRDTHQVLMLSHTVKVPRLNLARGQQGRNQANRQQMTQEEREKRAKEIQEALAKATEADMREVEIRWLISDYRNVNGINIPHKITKSVGGQPFDRVEIKNIKVNPALKPDKFVKR